MIFTDKYHLLTLPLGFRSIPYSRIAQNADDYILSDINLKANDGRIEAQAAKPVEFDEI
jgi:hypothetical protein